MLETAGEFLSSSRRKPVRHAVSIDAELVCDQWEGSVFLPAKALSSSGIWVETPLPIETGEAVLVSLTPPGWPSGAPLVAWATVARVDLPRRRTDRREAGMELAFTDLGSRQRRLLENVLHRLPSPVP